MLRARLTRYRCRLIPKADRKKIHEYLFRGKHWKFLLLLLLLQKKKKNAEFCGIS